MASRRGYLSLTELAEYADITITDNDEAYDQISQAEEEIDAYVGFQQKAVQQTIEDKIAVGGSSTATLADIHQNNFDIDYLKGCEIEILGGAGEGQRRIITGQTRAGVVTFDSAFSPALTTTSFYKIYQLGKFPRHCDMTAYNRTGDSTYYKRIPEAVKRAVAAQIQYKIEMGDAFFASDKSALKSESIGDYSYSRSDGATTDQLIAPKAKQLLRGITNRKGAIIG